MRAGSTSSKEQLVGPIGQAAHDVAVARGAAHATRIVAFPALAAAVERRHREAATDPAELAREVAAVAGVAVKLE